MIILEDYIIYLKLIILIILFSVYCIVIFVDQLFFIFISITSLANKFNFQIQCIRGKFCRFLQYRLSEFPLFATEG